MVMNKKDKLKNHITRVGDKFDQKIKSIMEKNKNIKSIRMATDLIIKHENWSDIEYDLITYKPVRDEDE